MSRAKQLETEGSISLARNRSNNVEEWRDKRRRSDPINKEKDQERRNQRQPCPVHQEEQQKSTKDRYSSEFPIPVRHEESWQPRKDQFGPDESSPGDPSTYDLRRRHQISGRQEQSKKCRDQPYKRRNKGTTHHEVHSEQRNQGIQDLWENHPSRKSDSLEVLCGDPSERI
ncbi:hypothetical protein TNIN_408481 [Trichonephila inaurata madagascariensis]|uniref:Uncharacterized protein n=1 Tax=Trichonephila inaurata madagascariensis TaxID=2747483 RepID=A0A8X6YHV9_9ARAC|nr:hypothetical protein TNIN_408481 [Trichonephila inaurata madagascariensis]